MNRVLFFDDHCPRKRRLLNELHILNSLASNVAGGSSTHRVKWMGPVNWETVRANGYILRHMAMCDCCKISTNGNTKISTNLDSSWREAGHISLLKSSQLRIVLSQAWGKKQTKKRCFHSKPQKKSWCIVMNVHTCKKVSKSSYVNCICDHCLPCVCM